MARHNSAGRPVQPRATQLLEPYDMFQSIKHDPKKVLPWCKMAERIKTKPRKQFASISSQRAGRYLLPPAEAEAEATTGQKENLLADLLEVTDVGGMVLEHLYAEGWRDVHSLAIASKRTWKAVALNTKTWDMLAGCPQIENRSSVLVATVPDYTVGMLRDAGAMTHEAEAGQPIAQAAKHSQDAERSTYDMVKKLFKLTTKTKPYWSPSDTQNGPGQPITDEKKRKAFVNAALEPTNRLFEEVASLKYFPKFEQWNKLAATPENLLYQPPAGLMSCAIEGLMKKIWSNSAGLKVLYLHNIPMLDIRLVAILLQGCPEVHTLGIYDCPLIHFGDVIPLLDLIWHTNRYRQAIKRPRITSFDFYPHYQPGMPYEYGRCATYGITWGPENREVVLRGFYAIILKAYMKSKSQALRLLFEQRKAFVTYLKRVPNLPWGVSQFLDALRRFTSLDPNHKNYKNKRLQAMYDLLAPIRVVLSGSWRDDWPKWFERNLGAECYLCVSCGYEMLSAFFNDAEVNVSREQRVCAACRLQSCLGEETDHLKVEKRKAITQLLLPLWRIQRYEPQAPIYSRGTDLLRHRPDAFLWSPNDDANAGAGEQPPRTRRQDIVGNSLQGLPTLDELVTGYDPANTQRTGFARFHAACQYLDAHRRTLHLLNEQWSATAKGSGVPAFCKSRLDGGYPDHVYEKQHALDGGESAISFNFETAYQAYRDIFPSKTKEGQKRAAERAEKLFW